MNPYATARIYGPYLRKDGRKHVICIYPDGKRQTVSYPKYVVESIIGRRLVGHEEVHHINGDATDNSFENLEIVDKIKHVTEHVRRLISQDFICPVCNKLFTLDTKQLSDVISNRKRHINRDKFITGPYCSKSCAGKGSNVRTEISVEYYNLLSPSDENDWVDAANSAKPLVNGNTELG